MERSEKFLLINSYEDARILKALSSEIRINILNLLTTETLNVNQIAERLKLPQSTVATNIAILEKAGLIETEIVNGKKGNQKLCRTRYEEIMVQFITEKKPEEDNTIEVEMPIGLYTNFHVTPPCGLCSSESIIGYLDVPDSFLLPERAKAALLWFETGWVEYQFPNNSLYRKEPLQSLEVSMELSSEIPGTNKQWPSDITVWINNKEVGTWECPGDFGDKRGKYTPEWWKLEGSQYGLLKNWSVTESGSYIDGVKVSDVTLSDLDISKHHSIRVKVGVKEESSHPGGVNIFGRGFGNYDQGVVLRLYFKNSKG